MITAEKLGVKYPIADYELTSDMAIVDPEFVMGMFRTPAVHSGLDALEAFTSTLATNFADGQAMEAARLVFKYLAVSCRGGEGKIVAREKMHYAATIAGMAFANAFLGVCHSISCSGVRLPSVACPRQCIAALVCPQVQRHRQTCQAGHAAAV